MNLLLDYWPEILSIAVMVLTDTYVCFKQPTKENLYFVAFQIYAFIAGMTFGVWHHDEGAGWFVGATLLAGWTLLSRFQEFLTATFPSKKSSVS